MYQVGHGGLSREIAFGHSNSFWAGSLLAYGRIVVVKLPEAFKQVP